MNVRRSAVAAVLAWLAVVAVGSTMVWAVISRAGDGVAPTADPGVAGTTTSPSGKTSHTPSHTPSSGPSRTPSHAPSQTPSHTASSGPSRSPSSGPSSGPSHQATSSGPTGPTAVRRTWQGPGGLVIASCRGPAISLVSYSADAGFRVEVGSRGPEELEITFEGQGEEGRETQVKARCESGSPVFDVETSDDD